MEVGGLIGPAAAGESVVLCLGGLFECSPFFLGALCFVGDS